MYCPDVYKQAKDIVLMVTAAFLLGRLYEKIKHAKKMMDKEIGE